MSRDSRLRRGCCDHGHVVCFGFLMDVFVHGYGVAIQHLDDTLNIKTQYWEEKMDFFKNGTQNGFSGRQVDIAIKLG